MHQTAARRLRRRTAPSEHGADFLLELARGIPSARYITFFAPFFQSLEYARLQELSPRHGGCGSLILRRQFGLTTERDKHHFPKKYNECFLCQLQREKIWTRF